MKTRNCFIWIVIFCWFTSCSDEPAVTAVQDEDDNSNLNPPTIVEDNTANTDTTDYFDVVTYNIEWLGKPSRAELNISRAEQLTKAAEDIIEANADIYALQEIIVDDLNGNGLADLVEQLNNTDDENTWGGMYNDYFSYWWSPDFNEFPAQRQAYIYKESKVSNLKFSTLLTSEVREDDRRFASGRLPFMMEADVTINGKTQRIYLFNLHLKCCRGSADRRKASMELLLAELNVNYADKNVIILGDLNVADRGGANGEITTWGTYADNDNDNNPDYVHAAGAVQDLSFDDIDHILISSELLEEYQNAPQTLRNQILRSSISDHDLVKATMDFR